MIEQAPRRRHGPGDVLVALNGVEIGYANQEALKAAKSKLGVGKQVTYTVQRDGAQREIAREGGDGRRPPSGDL